VKAVLDAGAFAAVDKRDRRIGAMLRVLQQHRIPLATSAAVIAQVWRDGRRQAMLARILDGVGIRALGVEDARRTGELQGAAASKDVPDAHVALVVAEGDQVLTSDPVDLEHLLAARGVAATVVKV
jgi:hypothetical protein